MLKMTLGLDDNRCWRRPRVSASSALCAPRRSLSSRASSRAVRSSTEGGRESPRPNRGWRNRSATGRAKRSLQVRDPWRAEEDGRSRAGDLDHLASQTKRSDESLQDEQGVLLLANGSEGHIDRWPLEAEMFVQPFPIWSAGRILRSASPVPKRSAAGRRMRCGTGRRGRTAPGAVPERNRACRVQPIWMRKSSCFTPALHGFARTTSTWVSNILPSPLTNPMTIGARPGRRDW